MKRIVFLFTLIAVVFISAAPESDAGKRLRCTVVQEIAWQQKPDPLVTVEQPSRSKALFEDAPGGPQDIGPLQTLKGKAVGAEKKDEPEPLRALNTVWVTFQRFSKKVTVKTDPNFEFSTDKELSFGVRMHLRGYDFSASATEVYVERGGVIPGGKNAVDIRSGENGSVSVRVSPGVYVLFKQAE